MIKVLKSDLNSVAFNTESLDLYPLPAGVADSLSSDELPTSKESNKLFKHDRINDNRTRIAGLVLLITQTCNLKCSYCFAQAYMGSHSDNRVMSPATACVAIEKVFKSVPDLRRILFFGGEPLIGFATIKEAVQASEEYCMAHQAQMPAFTISTNGTLIDQEVMTPTSVSPSIVVGVIIPPVNPCPGDVITQGFADVAFSITCEKGV